ncbi:MAG: DUF177 domain-containing protein [Candidatus Binatia bacterium]
MKIPVQDIKSEPAEIHFVEDMDALDFVLTQGREAEYRSAAPLQVDMTYMRSGTDLLFSGVLQTQLVGQCGRCLEEFPLPLVREYSLVLRPQQTLNREVELSADELSASFYNEEDIDVSSLIYEEVLLTLPSCPLCREDCKGLCPECGVNLNVESCNCRSAWKDPRLAVLSQLRVLTKK